MAFPIALTSDKVWSSFDRESALLVTNIRDSMFGININKHGPTVRPVYSLHNRIRRNQGRVIAFFFLVYRTNTTRLGNNGPLD